MRFMAGGDRQLAHAMHLNTSYRELLLSSLCTDARALSASCPCHPLPLGSCSVWWRWRPKSPRTGTIAGRAERAASTQAAQYLAGAVCSAHPRAHAAEQCGGVPQHFRVCVVSFARIACQTAWFIVACGKVRQTGGCAASDVLFIFVRFMSR